MVREKNNVTSVFVQHAITRLIFIVCMSVWGWRIYDMGMMLIFMEEPAQFLTCSLLMLYFRNISFLPFPTLSTFLTFLHAYDNLSDISKALKSLQKLYIPNTSNMRRWKSWYTVIIITYFTLHKKEAMSMRPFSLTQWKETFSPFSQFRFLSPSIHSSPCNTWSNHTTVAMEDRGEASNWLRAWGCLVQSLLELASWEAEPQLASLLAEHSAAQTASESCRERHPGSGLHWDSHTHTLHIHAHTQQAGLEAEWPEGKQTGCDVAEEDHGYRNVRPQHTVTWMCAEV